MALEHGPLDRRVATSLHRAECDLGTGRALGVGLAAVAVGSGRHACAPVELSKLLEGPDRAEKVDGDRGIVGRGRCAAVVGDERIGRAAVRDLRWRGPTARRIGRAGCSFATGFLCERGSFASLVVSFCGRRGPSPVYGMFIDLTSQPVVSVQ